MILFAFYSILIRADFILLDEIDIIEGAMTFHIRIKIVTLLMTCLCTNAMAVNFKTHKVTENIYVLFGQGGNIAIHLGEDGIYIVDDQFAKLSKQIKKQISALKPGFPEFVINTHFHGDHTGGNEAFARSGSHVIAHDNVHKRLLAKHGSELHYLPKISFSHDLALHFNNEQAQVKHFSHAHTDGDAVVTFTRANVVHMGDLYFNLGGLPFIDVDHGGSVNGLLKALRAISLSIDDETVVIPGHGQISNKNQLLQYIALIEKARFLILQAMKSAKTEEQMVQLDPLSTLAITHANWLPKERVTRLFYRSLAQ
ncbi:MBL fold metallo-hydrolase [Pseudoalteromonas sp. MMG005]|nr:MBL fold metallo-hydrolase [Pseudoalteromonas sp. MMG005]